MAHARCIINSIKFKVSAGPGSPGRLCPKLHWVPTGVNFNLLANANTLKKKKSQLRHKCLKTQE